MTEKIIQGEVTNRIFSLNKIIIYGAGVMGRALKMCLESKPYNKKVHCFIVSNTANNPEMIDGTPVIGIEDADDYKNEMIIVALNETNMPSAVKALHNHGFNSLMMLNAAGDEWAYIKENYFLDNQDQCYIPFKILPERI